SGSPPSECYPIGKVDRNTPTTRAAQSRTAAMKGTHAGSCGAAEQIMLSCGLAPRLNATTPAKALPRVISVSKATPLSCPVARLMPLYVLADGESVEARLRKQIAEIRVIDPSHVGLIADVVFEGLRGGLYGDEVGDFRSANMELRLTVGRVREAPVGLRAQRHAGG